ncbi:hypothetical protein BCR44DRAFT_1427025 [Catenaria anguillulae PL171]|uniref:Uncharacterized protein n=1 Tax=Catenaria anguillulae PL171 TaxID=765915 RepID=A0A1Y2HZ66_9FUNG|nr:hypothetical protein BCR44DRAFT_1427025 [Catenaria anguillulae PL171]
MAVGSRGACAKHATGRACPGGDAWWRSGPRRRGCRAHDGGACLGPVCLCARQELGHIGWRRGQASVEGGGGGPAHKVGSEGNGAAGCWVCSGWVEGGVGRCRVTFTLM